MVPPGVGEDATAAQTVIEGIVGTGMGVAAYLAEMRTDYGLVYQLGAYAYVLAPAGTDTGVCWYQNGRYNLGYWINPGYAWGQVHVRYLPRAYAHTRAKETRY
eukprot:3439985-Rhodomonas_salina.2